MNYKALCYTLYIMLKQFKESPFLIFSLMFYVASLFSPASTDPHGFIGLQILFLGWIGLLTADFAWLANIFIVISFTLNLNKAFRPALFLSLLACLVALQSFSGVPVSYSNGTTAPGLAFYLWEASFIFLSIYSLRQILLQKTTPASSFRTKVK